MALLALAEAGRGTVEVEVGAHGGSKVHMQSVLGENAALKELLAEKELKIHSLEKELSKTGKESGVARQLDATSATSPTWTLDFDKIIQESPSVAACSGDDDALYGFICEHPMVREMEETYYKGRRMFDSGEPGEMEKLQEGLASILSRRASITGKLRDSLPGNLGAHPAFAQALDSVMIDTSVSEETFVAPGSYIGFGANEVHMESAGFTEYTDFALGHELGHAIDFLRGEIEIGAPETLDMMKASAFNETREAIMQKWPNLGLRACEVWADYLGAWGVLGSFNPHQQLRAMRAFCFGGSNPTMYPDTRSRVLMLAKNPAVFPKLCPGSEPPLYGATCLAGKPDFGSLCGPGCCDEQVCSFAQGVPGQSPCAEESESIS
jgi:hypothetical protein